jgi:RHS repeat-associated protein
MVALADKPLTAKARTFEKVVNRRADLRLRLIPAEMRSQLEASLELTDLWVRSGVRLTNFHRWYDAAVGRWVSEDPVGFAAGDANIYRYVGNEVSDTYDLSGLSKIRGKKKLSQGRFWIKVGDETYSGTDAQEFEDAIDEIESNGDTADRIIVKGHGNEEGVYDDDGNPFIEVRGKGINVNDGRKNSTLENITDGNTQINLRGCSTNEAAEKLAENLDGPGNDDGPNVTGTPIPVIGIPWTPIAVGPWNNHDGDDMKKH